MHILYHQSKQMTWLMCLTVRHINRHGKRPLSRKNVKRPFASLKDYGCTPVIGRVRYYPPGRA